MLCWLCACSHLPCAWRSLPCSLGSLEALHDCMLLAHLAVYGNAPKPSFKASVWAKLRGMVAQLRSAASSECEGLRFCGPGGAGTIGCCIESSESAALPACR